jgi:hypothetical protein
MDLMLPRELNVSMVYLELVSEQGSGTYLVEETTGFSLDYTLIRSQSDCIALGLNEYRLHLKCANRTESTRLLQLDATTLIIQAAGNLYDFTGFVASWAGGFMTWEGNPILKLQDWRFANSQFFEAEPAQASIFDLRNAVWKAFYAVGADTWLGLFTEKVGDASRLSVMRAHNSTRFYKELYTDVGSEGATWAIGPQILVVGSLAANASSVLVWDYITNNRTELTKTWVLYFGHAVAGSGAYVAAASLKEIESGFQAAILVYSRQYTDELSWVGTVPTELYLKVDGSFVLERTPIVKAMAINRQYLVCIFEREGVLQQNVFNLLSGEFFDNTLDLRGLVTVQSIFWVSNLMVISGQLASSANRGVVFASTGFAYPLVEQSKASTAVACSPVLVDGTRLVTGTSRNTTLCVVDSTTEDIHRYRILQPPINTRMQFDIGWNAMERPVIETIPPLSAFQLLRVVSQPTRTVISISLNESLPFFDLRLAANASINYRLNFTLAAAAASECNQCQPHAGNLNSEVFCSSGRNTPATLAAECAVNESLDLVYPAAGCCLESKTLRVLKTISFFNLLGSTTTLRLQSTVRQADMV